MLIGLWLPVVTSEDGVSGQMGSQLLSSLLFLQLLEYIGKGKSIIDVGLAQARQPLSTRSHYFEVEIVDPGEKCYIALGLARKVRKLRRANGDCPALRCSFINLMFPGVQSQCDIKLGETTLGMYEGICLLCAVY